MEKTDVGRKAVAIISHTSTIKGTITKVSDDLKSFDITDSYGNVMELNISLIIGIRYPADGDS